MPRMNGRRVTLKPGPALTATIAKLRESGDVSGAHALNRLRFTGTTCRVVAESKTALTLKVRGGKHPFVVPREAVKSANQRRS
jgi:hypothetical protein